MLKNFSMILFYFLMLFGTLLTISANSWLGVWMGLEINLLSFIPLMMKKKNLNSTEASLNYFLVQAFASSLILFSIIMFSYCNYFGESTNFMNKIMKTNFIFLSLMIKLGAAPFHFWFTNVMDNLMWMEGLILMTWQKIAPMMIISYIFSLNNLMMCFVIMSAIIGALGGLNQVSLRKLMAFSSINNMSWMLVCMLFNEYLWMFYFIIYVLMNIMLICLFETFKLYYINQLSLMYVYSPMMKFSILMSILSLGGLPPFLGFFSKWIVIQSMITMKMYLLSLLMILMSLITLFFYLKISMTSFLFINNELNINMKTYMKMNFKMMIIMNLINMLGMILFIDMFFLIY